MNAIEMNWRIKEKKERKLTDTISKREKDMQLKKYVFTK